jgi:hypothetical protein
MSQIQISKYSPAIIIVAIFLLIFITVWAIRIFGQSDNNIRRFPPYLSPCPDYWTNLGNGKCKREPNLNNGRAKCDNISGNNDPTSNYSLTTSGDDRDSYGPGTENVNLSNKSLVEKCKWAKKCNIYWEGISDRPCTNKSFENYTA